jgi:hypothetical protein
VAIDASRDAVETCGIIGSGQAAEMCGISRVSFLFEAGKLGVPVAELSEDELSAEFA